VVVLVDGAAHGAEAVVAVGEHVGHGEARHAAGPGRLDDAHIGDVVGDEAVEFDAQLVLRAAGVVGAEDGIGDGVLPARHVGVRGGNGPSAAPDHRAVVKLEHRYPSL
jgi:hypothetical protein